MSIDKASGRSIIWLTILAALLLQVMPMPPLLENARPDWCLLAVIYWSLALPHRFNVFSGCLVGITLDVLLGGTIGVRGLAFSLVVYVVVLQYRRFRHWSLLQQVVGVTLLSAIVRVTVYWIEYVRDPDLLVGVPYAELISTPLLWPWAFWLLRRTRRRFKVR